MPLTFRREVAPEFVQLSKQTTTTERIPSTPVLEVFDNCSVHEAKTDSDNLRGLRYKCDK